MRLLRDYIGFEGAVHICLKDSNIIMVRIEFYVFEKDDDKCLAYENFYSSK